MVRRSTSIIVGAAVLLVASLVYSQAEFKTRDQLLEQKKALERQYKDQDYYTGPDHPTRRRLERQIKLLEDALTTMDDPKELPVGAECQCQTTSGSNFAGTLVGISDSWVGLADDYGQVWIPRERVDHLRFPK